MVLVDYIGIFFLHVAIFLATYFSFTVYARAWWSAFMHPAGLSTIFQMCQYFTIYRQYFFLKIAKE
jgi:hypothetical protein